MSHGKLDFRRDEVKAGAVYGMFFPETISKVIYEGKRAFMVELTEDKYKKYGALEINECGFYEMRITSPDFDGIKEWYEIYERKGV